MDQIGEEAMEEEDLAMEEEAADMDRGERDRLEVEAEVLH